MLLVAAAVLGFPGTVRIPRAPADTIYALAVDSTRHREEPFVYLLDDGVLRYEADGRGSTTYRQVIQILKESAVEQWAERSFSYEPRHQRLTVNWIRVVGLDGSVISDKPAISQDADIPAPMGDPTYAEQKVRRFSLSNVRPGTLIDYSYTVEELKPFRPRDFFSAWRITTGLPVRRSRLVLDTPAERRRLNAIVHPLVRQWMAERTAEAVEGGAEVVVQDVPLLFENGLQGLFSGTVLVYARPAIQLRRLIEERGLSAVRADAVLAAQMPIDEKRPLADFVVDNNGSLDETRRQVEEVWARVRPR